MTSPTREELVAKLVFQDASQKADLLDDSVTKTQLIGLLLELTVRGFHIEITAVKSDHHDDSYLGEHCHFNGYCADCWPLNSPTPGDYMDASSPEFRKFLEAAAASSYRFQIGLAGDGPNDPTNYADSPANMAAAGSSAFHDDGGPHVHLGANGP
jgi:hypothetical protein